MASTLIWSHLVGRAAPGDVSSRPSWSRKARSLARQILEDPGNEVVIADDGRQGRERLREEIDRFSLVFLDMTMPQLSGDELGHALRRIRPDSGLARR